MGNDEPRDLRERIRQAIAVLIPEFPSREAEEVRDESVLDAAARSLSAVIARWGEETSLQRLFGGVEHDILTSPGERVELTAHLGIAARLGTTVRFYLDDAFVLEVPIGKGTVVRGVAEAPGAGLYRIGVRVCDAAGAELSNTMSDRVLQVASGRPVVLVHTDLLLLEPSEDAPDLLRVALEALTARGFELAYVDTREKNRDTWIRDAVRIRELPIAATLTHPAEIQRLRSLGVDFVRVFGQTVVRRLRARGVPVTTVLTDLDVATDAAESESLTVLAPEDAIERAGQGALDREVHRAEAMMRRRNETDRLTWRLDQTTGSTLVPDNRFHAELDNERARKSLFDAIDSAASSIDLQFYIVRASAFTESLIVKLIQRARAGVRVRLMVDALYSEEEVFGRVNPLIASLKAEANVDVLAVNPIEAPQDVDLELLRKRDHRKVAIIDGVRAFVSGRNASDEYFCGFAEIPIHDNTRHERIPWLDAHIEVHGPLVRQIQDMFVATWRAQEGTEVIEERDGPELAPAGSAAGRLVVHRGFEDANGLALYEEMLDFAQHHVYIVNDFPIVHALERAIERALTRGVEVVLLTGSASARRYDGTFFPGPLHRTVFEFMVKAKLEPLMQAGVRTYEFMPPASPLIVARGGRVRPYVHAKVMSVDGVVTSIGSANLDATASFWESEANVVVQDEGFASAVEATLRQLIGGSLELDLESEPWKRERAQRAIVDTLWPTALYS